MDIKRQVLFLAIDTQLFNKMSTPSHDEMIKHLRITIDIAARGRSMGHHPFGSTLVSPEGEILLQQCNFGPVFHAESELARVAGMYG